MIYIKKFLEDEGAWHVKFFANSRTRSGIPDILACVNGYFVGIEVKSQGGHASPLQLHHCEKIRNAGGYAFIVYPSGFEKLKQFIYGLNCDRIDELPIILR